MSRSTPIRPWQRLVPLLLSLMLLGCEPKSEPVSVIIVDVDTLRADHLGCYGYGRPTSPSIDAFCRESVQFLWTFSQAPNTPPSQASILTSLYPTTHGRIKDEQVLPAANVTLAETFQAAGYQTAAFVDGGLMAAEFGLDQGFDIYDDKAGGVAKIDGKAKAWLRQRGDNPFLLLIHTYDVHSPYETTPEPFRSTFLKGLEAPKENFVEHMTQRMEQRRLSRYGDNPHSLTQTEVEYAKALYDGGILHVDDWFGKFVQFLQEQDIYENSIIAFISDHGDEFEEHDSVFHEKLYSPVTRVPLLIRFPGGVSARKVSDVVETIDLMPTLLGAVGLEPPEGIQGQDLASLIEERGGHRDLAISESPFFGRRIALATSGYRLFYTAKHGHPELYRYREDVLEQHDLAADEPEITQRLVEAVKSWETLVLSKQHTASEVLEMKESTLKQLRTLGYIDN